MICLPVCNPIVRWGRSVPSNPFSSCRFVIPFWKNSIITSLSFCLTFDDCSLSIVIHSANTNWLPNCAQALWMLFTISVGIYMSRGKHFQMFQIWVFIYNTGAKWFARESDKWRWACEWRKVSGVWEKRTFIIELFS